MKKIVSTILLSVLFATVHGQDKIWSLEECMHYALENSPNVKRQQYSNGNYRQDYVASIAGMLPSVGAGIGTSSGFGRSLDGTTNTYINTSNFNNTYSLSANIPVFNGFVLVNQLRFANVGRMQGQEELQKVRDDVSFDVMSAYFDVIYYSGTVGLSREMLEANRRDLLRTRELEELGLKSNADAAQIEAQVASSETLLIRQQNLLTHARTVLKNTMNYPIEQPLPVDTLILMVEKQSVGSAEDIFADAKQQHATAKIADYSLRRSQLNFSMSKGYLYPNISVSGNYGTGYYNTQKDSLGRIFPFNKQVFQNNRGGGISVSLGIPIFNRLSQRTSVNRSRNNLRIAEQNHAETLRSLHTAIQTAVDDCEGLAREYLQAGKQVDASSLAYRVNQRKYDEGLLSPLELQTSSNQLLSSRVTLLNVKLQYIIKCRVVEYYKGISYIDQVQ